MRSAWLRRRRYVPHDNHLSLRQWKMSTHSIRKCATKPCQVIVSSHDNSLWRHTLLERRSLRLARLTHSGLPVDVEHTPTMFAHCNKRSPVPIIRHPGTTLSDFHLERGVTRFHIRQKRVCYQNRFSPAQNTEYKYAFPRGLGKLYILNIVFSTH